MFTESVIHERLWVLLTKISHFTSTITEKLDGMTFHERQALARQVLEEVVICDNTVKLFFKVPMTNNNPSVQKKLNWIPMCQHN
jgi:hypothetical protein